MTTVFISGSLHIKNLDSNVKKRIQNIISQNFSIVLGDADGVDSSIQKFLLEEEVKQVTVFCSGNQPRNNFGHWPVRSVETEHKEGTRAFFTAKDLELAKSADFGLMIWDTKSTGTLSNVIEMLRMNKKSVVYVNKIKDFINVIEIKDLEKLLEYMSKDSIEKAEAKIGLKKKVESLKYVQPTLFKE